MDSSLVISIRSQYVRQILDGSKRFEYRKTIPKRDIKYLVLCETGSHAQIVGIVEVTGVLFDRPLVLWALTKYASGISYREFQSYYKHHSKGVVFCLGSVWRPIKGIHLGDMGIERAPQSIQYIETTKVEVIINGIEPTVKRGHGRLFLGGVHGVGKTAFASRISQSMNCNHYTASALISNGRDGALSNHRLSNTDVVSNQDALCLALGRTAWYENGGIVDGHFVLKDGDGAEVEIPMSTYQSICPEAIVVMHNDPMTIALRLVKRDSCNSAGVDKLAASIQSMQEHELRRARFVARHLKIPFSKIRI